MKKSTCATIIGLTILVFTGCAPVKFYSNSGLTQNAGLKYYTVKPYLMVERDPVSSNVLKAMVFYMPDLENPQYMVIKNGIGSKKVDLKLTDGSLNTFGVDSDMKIAESLNALAGLISKGTTAIADLSILKSNPSAAASSSITELYEVIMKDGITSVKKIEIK